MGAQVSSHQQRSYQGTVNSIHSANNWNSQFQRLRGSNKLMVIDFSADWWLLSVGHDISVDDDMTLCSCLPASGGGKDVEFIKIDVDELPEVAKDFEVQAMPTFVLVKKGKERERIVGVKKDELHRMIEKHRF